jgi:Ca2+:H+ antiporter
MDRLLQGQPRLSPIPDQPAEDDVDFSPPERRLAGERFQWRISQAARRPLFYGYKTLLLVFVPFGIIAGTLGWPAEAAFILNVLAIIPLGPLIVSSVDELSPFLGHTSGRLVKTISGNAVEMVVRYP